VKRMSGTGKEGKGYTFNERAIREIARKANKVVGRVWGTGERKWGDDFRRRMMMFQSMIERILMYREEIWGWMEQEEVEKLPETYLRWVLEVKRNATLHGEEKVQEKKAEGESGKDSGKV
jgi:hypothetical protein